MLDTSSTYSAPKCSQLNSRQAHDIAWALLQSYAGRDEFEFGPFGSLDIENIIREFEALGCRITRIPGVSTVIVRTA